MTNQFYLDEAWETLQRHGKQRHNPHFVLDRLIEIYEQANQLEKRFYDEWFGKWLLGKDKTKRFDAVCLIEHFGIATAIPQLETLRMKIADEPEAPFLRRKIDRIISQITTG